MKRPFETATPSASAASDCFVEQHTSVPLLRHRRYVEGRTNMHLAAASRAVRPALLGLAILGSSRYRIGLGSYETAEIELGCPQRTRGIHRQVWKLWSNGPPNFSPEGQGSNKVISRIGMALRLRIIGSYGPSPVSATPTVVPGCRRHDLGTRCGDAGVVRSRPHRDAPRL